MEEQFYLFVAPFLAITIYLSPNLRLCVLVVLFLLPTFFRYMGWYETTAETHVRLDGCLMGVMLASIKYQQQWIWRLLVRYSGSIALTATVFCVLFFYQRWFPLSWLGDPGFLVRSLMFGAWVVYANSGGFARWYLYFPGSYYIATRSYAIYLLHPDAIAITNRLPLDLSFFPYMMVVFIISVIASELLYRIVEMPFMKLRSKTRMAH